MSSVLLAIVVLVVFYLAYSRYGRFLAGRIFRLNDANITPAHAQEDGVDHVPQRCLL